MPSPVAPNLTLLKTTPWLSMSFIPCVCSPPLYRAQTAQSSTKTTPYQLFELRAPPFPLSRPGRTAALVSHPLIQGLSRAAEHCQRQNDTNLLTRVTTTMTTNLTQHCQGNLLHFARKFNFPVSGEAITLPSPSPGL